MKKILFFIIIFIFLFSLAAYSLDKLSDVVIFSGDLDTSKEEVAICNCCSCCCLTARDCLIFPVANATNYLASIDQDLCVGCGTCVEKCYNKAVYLNDDNKAERMEEYCVGCGVCAYFCPENAISLIEGERIVRMSPPRQQ